MPDWDYFDRLPPLLRHALAGAAFDYDSKWYWERLTEGFPVERLAHHARECDLQYALANQVSTLGNWQHVQPSVMAATGVRPLYR